MKKALITLFTAILALGFIACSDPAEDSATASPVTSTYSVTIEASENGSVTASKTSGIEAGETITLTVTPAEPDDGDCSLSSISVKNGEAEVALTNYTFTMPAANVTVKAVFDKITYIGIKKPSRAKKVGDIVFNDGSATPYTSELTLTDEQKDAAIAIIFYKGTGLNSDTFTVDSEGNMNVTSSDNKTSRTLGVGLKHNRSGLAWCTDSAAAYSKNITTIHCPADGDDGELIFTGDKNGSDNLEQIAEFLGENDDTTGDNAADRYPAFYFAKNYKEQKIGEETASRIPSGSEFEDGWYLPSIAELFQIYACRADTENGFDVNAAIELCGGDEFEEWDLHRSSSQSASDADVALSLNVAAGLCFDYNKDNDYDAYVCCIREFN